MVTLDFKNKINTISDPFYISDDIEKDFLFMESFFKKGLGSNAYRDAWSLFDQIIVSQPLLEEDYSSFRFYKAGIFNAQFLITKKGQYKGYPFRSFSWGGFTGGYSDHFPVFVHVIKEIH